MKLTYSKATKKRDFETHKKHVARGRKTDNVYLLLLRYAPTMMRIWMDREGLSHG
jgi:hypothetical protein